MRFEPEQAKDDGMSDEIVREFLVESNENLDSLDRELVILEKDPGNRKTLSGIFRTIHTIKGTKARTKRPRRSRRLSIRCCRRRSTWSLEREP